MLRSVGGRQWDRRCRHFIFVLLPDSRPLVQYRTHRTTYTYISRSMNHQRLDHQNQKLYMKKTSYSDVYSKHQTSPCQPFPRCPAEIVQTFFFLSLLFYVPSRQMIFTPSFRILVDRAYDTCIQFFVRVPKETYAVNAHPTRPSALPKLF